MSEQAHRAPRSAPSHQAAIAAIAQLSLSRFLHSKIIYVAAIFALFPLLPILIGVQEGYSPEKIWADFIGFAAFVELLVAALLTAPAIAEEIEDKTYVYLWSRPIEHWTILVGKLLTSGILGVMMLSATILLGSVLGHMSDSTVIAQSVLAIALGVLATGCVASSIGTLVPKHPLAVSIGYLLVLDTGVGAAPISASHLSILHNVLVMAGQSETSESVISAVLWLVGIAIFWSLITLRRLARRELSVGS